MLERHPYDGRPRYEYHLTAKGAELVLYRHHACGEISGVDLRCAHCGERMHAGDVDVLPGPGAAV
ncbi:hypothetical protein NE236_21850 [Actinoallomurus purpureus]|uniref:hypothetical protein n=1 Tax=Actinoallomurus purpureus TaxID=478114 RepID=UPI002093ECC1|nr:hypothetical protein [Actinoallomurus purpureus]MCO6007625.1 hypothetical protein [Actinoallomurus purpureus]